MTARVQMRGKQGYVAIEPKATIGATLGTSLFNADGSVFNPARLPNAADDIAAAAAGVSVGGLYRNGSVVMVRIT